MSMDFWVLTGFALFVIAIIFILIRWALPRISSVAVAAIIGALIGSSPGAFVGIWKATMDADAKLKDRISTHALELIKMDYEMRQKFLDLYEAQQVFLAPAKVYREFYFALYELHTTGNWPKRIEDLHLLDSIILGSRKSQQEKKTSLTSKDRPEPTP